MADQQLWGRCLQTLRQTRRNSRQATIHCVDLTELGLRVRDAGESELTCTEVAFGKTLGVNLSPPRPALIIGLVVVSHFTLLALSAFIDTLRLAADESHFLLNCESTAFSEPAAARMER